LPPTFAALNLSPCAAHRTASASTAAEDDRAKHRLLKNPGREDQLDPKMIDRLRASLKRYASPVAAEDAMVDLEVLSVSPGKGVGSLLPLQALWQELEFDPILSELSAGPCFSFSVPDVIQAIAFQRVLDRGSKRSLVHSFLPSAFASEFEGISLQHAKHTLRFLAEVGPELEARLTDVMTEKLFTDASLVLFDTTSTYFEGAVPEELAGFGFSRDKRGDRPQANLALLISCEGLPCGAWAKRAAEDARYDGKWVPRTTTSLPPEMVALAYRGLWRVKSTFRTLNDPTRTQAAVPYQRSRHPRPRASLRARLRARARH